MRPMDMDLDGGYVEERRRVGRPGGSLYVGGDGFSLSQDEAGQRVASRIIGGRPEVFRRPDAVAFERVQRPGSEFGRELRPGEVQVLRPLTQQSTLPPQRSIMDLNGDGIPDGAEVVQKFDDGRGTVTTAKFLAGGRPGDLAGQGATRGEEIFQAGRARDAQARMGESMTGFAGGRPGMALDRNTRGGVTAADRLLGDRREATRQAGDLARTEAQFVRPEEARQAGAFARMGAAQAGQTERAGMVTAENAARRQENARQFNWKMAADAVKAIAAKAGSGPQLYSLDDKGALVPGGGGKSPFVVHNGVMMRVAQEGATPDGFNPLMDKDGNQNGWLTKDGVALVRDAQGNWVRLGGEQSGGGGNSGGGSQLDGIGQGGAAAETALPPKVNTPTPLTAAQAQQFKDAAGGDRKKGEQLAREAGYTF